MKLQLDVTGVGAGRSAARVLRLVSDAVRHRENEKRHRRDQNDSDRALASARKKQTNEPVS